ncbi:MAG TPA: FecR domain-containing protein [Agriterribacter sp.]|nr:FecR domain-containing protein [Agriterribacter sp.]
MQQDKMDVADLLADESFINYCKESSPGDMTFWENYMAENPGNRALVELARERYVALLNVLAEADMDEQEMRLKSRLEQKDSAPVVQMGAWPETQTKNNRSILVKISAAAAVVLAVALFAVNYFNTGKPASSKTFVTAYGERKNIQLPDGSVVNLNAGSKIEIKENFGVTDRHVYLQGEAFFDVKHDAKLPFIVHTTAMDVKALGTAFDVKAYSNEKTTETSLIRGLVEVTLKENDNRVLLLHPNEKVKWEQPVEETGAAHSSLVKKKEPSDMTDGLMKKLVATDRGDIKEIAWKENKLIFEDDALGDIAILLERWYGAKIEFEDDAIKNYRYTGTYEKEDLGTVLDFMKESKHFNFKMERGETLKIVLSK